MVPGVLLCASAMAQEAPATVQYNPKEWKNTPVYPGIKSPLLAHAPQIPATNLKKIA